MKEQLPLKDFKKIQHLYARAGFGLSPQEYLSKKNNSLDRELKELFFEGERQSKTPIKQDELFSQISSLKYSSMKKKERRNLNQVEARKRMNLVRLNWLKRMTNGINSPLQERMCLFWHGHFACYVGKPHMAINQLNIFRKNGLGSFRDMLHEISKDVGMLFYLNNQQNKKGRPNENYARELLELFTLGKGNYSETDIKAGARAFTGWTGDFNGTYIFEKKNHDRGAKVFMGKRGGFNGNDIVNIILEDKRTALFLCEKIYAYFVNVKIDKNRVIGLAEYFYKSDYNIKGLMKKIFSSDWFYEKANIKTKVKSPIDLISTLTKAIDLKFDGNSFLFIQKRIDQILFHPPNVAGWPIGKEWISSSNLYSRLQLSHFLTSRNSLAFENEEGNDEMSFNGQGNISFNKRSLSSIGSGERKKDIIIAMMDYARVDSNNLLEEVYKHSNKTSEGIFALDSFIRISSLPEYQLC